MDITITITKCIDCPHSFKVSNEDNVLCTGSAMYQCELVDDRKTSGQDIPNWCPKTNENKKIMSDIADVDEKIGSLQNEIDKLRLNKENLFNSLGEGYEEK